MSVKNLRWVLDPEIGGPRLVNRPNWLKLDFGNFGHQPVYKTPDPYIKKTGFFSRLKSANRKNSEKRPF